MQGRGLVGAKKAAADISARRSQETGTLRVSATSWQWRQTSGICAATTFLCSSSPARPPQACPSTISFFLCALFGCHEARIPSGMQPQKPTNSPQRSHAATAPFSAIEIVGLAYLVTPWLTRKRDFNHMFKTWF